MNSLQAVGLTFANPDLTKAWSLPEFPTINVEALLEVHRKNVVALTKANQIVFDGLTTLARRERDQFESLVDDYTKATSDVLTGTSIEERAATQVNAAGHIYASSVARFLELSDIAVKANVSAMDIMNSRVTEVFDEIGALFVGRASRTTPIAKPSIVAAPITVVEELASIANAVAAVPSTATRAPRSAPKKSARAKVRSKTTARAETAGRRRTSRSRM